MRLDRTTSVVSLVNPVPENSEVDFTLIIGIICLRLPPYSFHRESDVTDVFRLQTDQLIELYISRPLEEQDAVEGARFKAKILIETDENESSSNQVETSHQQGSEPQIKISGIYDYLNCLSIVQDFDGLSTLIVRVLMSDERNESDICESAHLALTMTQCASKSGFKPNRSKLLCTRYLSISFILLPLFLIRFTKIWSGRAWRLKFRPDKFSKSFTAGK
jgi:hypothetical protein